MRNYFYITTTLPYINADPHIGFAMEIIRADTIARFYRLLDYKVFFNTGTDEHGQKIWEKAISGNLTPKKYADQMVKKFKNLKIALNLSYNKFIRTTNNHHVKAAQYFWSLCQQNGDIYKAKYQIKYCVGCELEKTESELVNNRCPFHPNKELQIFEEKNYFFRFSRYQKPLLNFYEKNPQFIKPEHRFEELKNFVKKGLKDFSISRPKKKMPWGIDVPKDNSQVMYVWFDALINYISTLGWPNDLKKFNLYWPGIQIAGKDNLRQQGAMWQAMLMSAKLPLTKKIFIEGFITANGQKMSKSLGNVIDPFSLVDRYGVDAVRYYFLKEIPPFADGDFSHQRMREIYNSELANELGNLVSRLTKLAEEDGLAIGDKDNKQKTLLTLKPLIDDFQFNQALEKIWKNIKKLNQEIDKEAPWKKNKNQREAFLKKSLIELREIGQQLLPFLPQTGESIIQSLQGKIKKIGSLFPKIQ